MEQAVGELEPETPGPEVTNCGHPVHRMDRVELGDAITTLANRRATLEAGDRVSDSERRTATAGPALLQHAGRDFVHGNHVESSTAPSHHCAHVAESHEHNEACKTGGAIDPAWEGVPPAGGDDTGPDDGEWNRPASRREQMLGQRLSERVRIRETGAGKQLGFDYAAFEDREVHLVRRSG